MSEHKERFYKPRWGLLWHAKNRLSGCREHLMFENCELLMFTRRSDARAFAHQKYGYIKTRHDLRVEPHGWRMPRPIKILGVLTDGWRDE